ncbi:MAG: hypothetical protein K8L99_26255 [Anaerolineae bacterium]|nr:hypothetical protein [Anaerolineae bacterium]
MSTTVAGVGSIFIDDIVLPDGRTYMNRLGGGVTHAMMGAAFWGTRPGLVALAGQDLPDTLKHELAQHLDTSGMHFLDAPQIRAWQIFEFDGTRRELYRTSVSEPFIQGAQPAHFPSEFSEVKGLYLLQDFEGLLRWRAAFDKFILWEPLQQIMQAANRDRFRATLREGNVDIISPNLAEARAIYGDQTPTQLVDALLEDGAHVAAIRMGPQGSIIGNQAGERCLIPAFPVKQIVDQTGAGNTYSGAFLLAITQGKSLTEAGAMGATAASFCLESIGLLNLKEVLREERGQRFRTLLAGVQSSTVAG